MSATATEGPSPFTSRKQRPEFRGNIVKKKLDWLDVPNMVFKYLRHMLNKQELGEALGTAGNQWCKSQLWDPEDSPSSGGKLFA